MKVGFNGHNYIVVFKHDNKCKIKPFKDNRKAEKYFYKMAHKYTSKCEWCVITLLDTMGNEFKRIMY